MYKLKQKQSPEKKGETVKFDKASFKAIRLKSDGSEHVEHKLLADRLIKKGLAEEIKGAELVDAAKAEAEALAERNGETKKTR